MTLAEVQYDSAVSPQKTPSLPRQHPRHTPAPRCTVIPQTPGCCVGASGSVPAHWHSQRQLSGPPHPLLREPSFQAWGSDLRTGTLRANGLIQFLLLCFQLHWPEGEKLFLLHHFQRNQPDSNMVSIQGCPEATVGCARSGFQACLWFASGPSRMPVPQSE